MTVNFGIVGYGRMAEIAHKKILDSTSGARLLAVCDITAARREAARAAGVERTYSSLAAMLRDPEIHAVTIATPSHIHTDIAIRAARAGKHIITEKPAATSAAGLRRMIAAAKRAGVHFTVFQNRRYDADFLACRKIVERKLVGEVVAYEARWHLYGSAKGFGVKEYKQEWREMKRYGGGILLDLGVHMLDQANQLAPGRPVSVFAALRGGVWAKDCDDYSSGMIQFDDGLVAVMEVSGLANVKVPRYRITGTKGMAVSNAEKKCMEIYIGKTEKPTKTIPFDAPQRSEIIYRTLVDAIRGKKTELAVTPESVVTTMQLIDAYVESSRTRRSVAIGGPRAK